MAHGKEYCKFKTTGLRVLPRTYKWFTDDFVLSLGTMCRTSLLV